jgi:hypothetical protein
MSRTEYRIGYQIWKDDQPKGRIWWHICHTRHQAEKFVSHLHREALVKRREYAIADVQVRGVGRWKSARDEAGSLPDWAIEP